MEYLDLCDAEAYKEFSDVATDDSSTRSKYYTLVQDATATAGVVPPPISSLRTPPPSTKAICY